jgi:hypothetical protein
MYQLLQQTIPDFRIVPTGIEFPCISEVGHEDINEIGSGLLQIPEKPKWPRETKALSFNIYSEVENT